MSYDEPDLTNPQEELQGVEWPDDRDVMRRTAATFADEFAHLGYTNTEILDLFRAPFYAAMHRTWELLGEAEIAQIVAESVRVWGRSGRQVVGARTRWRT